MTGRDLSPSPAVAWRRSARARRISLRVDVRTGAVVLTLPPRANAAAARAFIDDHAEWIGARLARLPPALAFAHGSTIPLHGSPARILHCPEGRGGAWLDGGAIRVAGDPAFLPRRVADFLRAEARRALGERAVAHAAGAGLRLQRVTIKDTATRWGSCTASGAIMLNWRLVMAPPFVQDYVAGHEVAHLRHMDHQAAFWALVDAITPHRIAALDWLRTGGPALMRVG